MTVVYTHETINGSRGFGNFIKLLFWWKGSIYQLVLPHLLSYSIFYYCLNLTYRLYISHLKDEHHSKQRFHQYVDYCKEVSKLIPLQFVLGFYVSQIVTRWWHQFMTIPWPDSLAMITATAIQGPDERGRMMRRTILRYVNLCLILTFCMISTQARARFPTMQHLVDAGFLLPHEKLIIDHLNEKLEGPKYYVPIVWAGAICAKARKEGRIGDDVALYHLVKELCKFRTLAADLLSYDWICIPLVYTQVVTLATYVYFAACLVGKQVIEREDQIDLYVPVFHFLEFFFLMGWLKVAETLINPFGDDQDDFEVNYLIDRNIMVSYLTVDEICTEVPDLVRDQYFDDVVPQEELFYTENARKFKTEGYRGSASAAPGFDPENRKERSIIHSTAHSFPRDRAGSGSGGSAGPAPFGKLLFDRTYFPHEGGSSVMIAKRKHST